MLFAESDLIELEARFPSLDVRKAAGKVERIAVKRRAVGDDVYDPARFLATMLERPSARREFRRDGGAPASRDSGPVVTWMRHADGTPLSVAERRNLDAWRVERGEIPPPLPEERSTPAYTAFRMAIIAEVMADGLTPGQVADRLEAHGEKFVLERPSLGPLLAREIAILRGTDDWRDVRDEYEHDPPSLPPEPEPGFPAAPEPEFAW